MMITTSAVAAHDATRTGVDISVAASTITA
jgi:hypothetical protein